jgi:hypothetical protein
LAQTFQPHVQLELSVLIKGELNLDL